MVEGCDPPILLLIMLVASSMYFVFLSNEKVIEFIEEIKYVQALFNLK